MLKPRFHLASAVVLVALSLTSAAQAQQKTPTSALPAQQQSGAQPAATPNPNAGHEYAPLLEKSFDYKDWTFKSLKDGSPVNLREFTRGKKLVMVVYFAPWCGNWKMQAPTVARFYDKYKQHGFYVVAVSEYASAEDTRKYFESQGGMQYAVVVESESRDDRDKTTHYNYRQSCSDSRKWGSPFNVFLEPAKLNKTGDVLTQKTWVVGGELIERDAEQFIREKLGLADNASVEPCEIKKQ